MSHCVFMHRSDSIYNDKPSAQYQFPKQYLSRAEPCVGDWVVYLEPVKVRGTRGYYAIARVQQIIPDLTAPGMYLAQIEPGTYLELSEPVPFSESDGPVERGLLNDEGRLSGRAQSAIRSISPTDFDRILERGLGDGEPILPRAEMTEPLTGLGEEDQESIIFEQPRVRVQELSSRTLRDRVFRRVVLRAYDERCAVTGLKFINGGGRAEVSAAHIRPVEKDGPDTVRNGIALSGTAHWMFDRGLISLGNDMTILISRQANDPDSIRGFVNKSGVAYLPKDKRDHPHPAFLEWHRTEVFKQ